MKIKLFLFALLFSSLTNAQSKGSPLVKDFTDDVVLFKVPSNFKQIDSFNNEIITRFDYDIVDKSKKSLGTIFIQKTENTSNFDIDSFPELICSNTLVTVTNDNNDKYGSYVKKVLCSDLEPYRVEYLKSFVFQGSHFVIGFIPSSLFVKKFNDEIDEKSNEQLNSIEIINICHQTKIDKNRFKDCLKSNSKS